MASEMGVLKIPEDQIVTKWRRSGKMLLVDLEQGRLIPDDEIKADLAKSHPYSDWLHRTQLVLEELPDAPVRVCARTCRCSTGSRRSAIRRKTSTS